ncbi:MAG: hypothetical protein AAFR31_02550 [Cyanobacteria bacterium J06627_8]
MKRSVLLIGISGFVLVAPPAIAQTSIEAIQPVEAVEDADVLPTENAGSADLITRPISTNSSTPADFNAEPISGTIQELRIVEPDVTLIEGTDTRSNGPANADHVQFVFN